MLGAYDLQGGRDFYWVTDGVILSDRSQKYSLFVIQDDLKIRRSFVWDRPTSHLAWHDKSPCQLRGQKRRTKTFWQPFTNSIDGRTNWLIYRVGVSIIICTSINQLLIKACPRGRVFQDLMKKTKHVSYMILRLKTRTSLSNNLGFFILFLKTISKKRNSMIIIKATSKRSNATNV